MLILSDYSEHFSVGYSKGLEEKDVIKSLGSPEDIIKNYVKGDVIYKKKRNRKWIYLGFVIYFAISLVLSIFAIILPTSSTKMHNNVYFDDTQVVKLNDGSIELTFENVSNHSYENIEMAVDITKKGNFGVVYETKEFILNIPANTTKTVPVHIGYENFNYISLKVGYKLENNSYFLLSNKSKFQKEYIIPKILISVMIGYRFIALTTFTILYIVKDRKDKRKIKSELNV